ncbi:MAG: extracellular solute-binding protein [Patescibacteria group bacterium]
MKNLSAFHIVIIALFILFLIVGTLIFAGILPGYRPTPAGVAGELTMWGTVPPSILQPILEQFNKDYKNYFTLRYEEKAGATLETEFVEAKADNRAPDLLLLPHDLGLTQRTRLAPLPPDFLSLRQFQDTFIDAGGLMIGDEGILALPLLVDPLVMYYNKNLLAEAGWPAPPRTWSEFISKTAALTTFDDRRNILKSAAALGETKNIIHAKDLLAMLLLQAGNPIISHPAAGNYVSTLDQSFNTTLKPAVAALDFYTQFADPARPNYSWNRSLPEARQAFSRGQTIFYFGYGSEYAAIGRENPHLAFDVALPPQPIETNQSKLILGRLLSVAAVRGGAKTNAAVSAAIAFSAAPSAGALASALLLPPARRDLLTQLPADPALALFYRAALLTRAWFDPDPPATKKIFDAMVESVVTGRLRSAEAVAAADRELNALLQKIYGRD